MYPLSLLTTQEWEERNNSDFHEKWSKMVERNRQNRLSSSEMGIRNVP